MEHYISKDQAPACCGGTCTHDQLEWVEFFKQAEPFLTACKTAGKSLLSVLSQLRNEDMPSQISRRFLNHQCRFDNYLFLNVNSTKCIVLSIILLFINSRILLHKYLFPFKFSFLGKYQKRLNQNMFKN